MLEQIQNQIQSGKEKVIIHNFIENSIDLALLLKKNLISPSCSLQKLWIYGTFMNNDSIKILMEGLKENHSIIELRLCNIFYDTDIHPSLEYINSMLKKNKNITHLSLIHCKIDKNIEILIDGLKKSNIILLNVEQNELGTKGIEKLKEYIEDSSCCLEIVNLSDNVIPKTTLEKKLLPILRKNISLYSVDIYGNLYSDEIEKKIEEKIKKETDINKNIEILWKQFSQQKSGLFTKEQENYRKKKPFNISQDHSRRPLPLRILIQEYLPRKTKLNHIELFIRWIIKEKGIDEDDERVQKLIKFEKNL